MKKNLIVSLVGAQTIPNVQFLKWYFENNECEADLLFISTKEMEAQNKTEMILKASQRLKNAGYICKCFIEKTDSDNIDITKDLLSDYFSSDNYSKIICNITGGNKLMSMALYEVAKNSNNTEIYYLPIGISVKQLFPKQNDFSTTGLLSLEEFLDANGISYRYYCDCIKDWDFNRNVFKEKVEKNRNVMKALVGFQETDYIKKKFTESGVANFSMITDSVYTQNKVKADRVSVCNTLQDFGFNPTALTEVELKYITGGWFEEYVYQYLLNEKKIDPLKLAINVAIEKGNDKNELDVVYLDESNRLNIIECKSFAGKDVLYDAIYKQHAIRSKFGLAVNESLYTKSIVSDKNVLNKVKDFGIKLVDGTMI